MKAALFILSLIPSCVPGSSAAPLEQFICAFAEEGLQQGYLCDLGPLEFHFKDKSIGPNGATIVCADSKYLVRTGVPSFKALPGQNVVFVYSQYGVGDGLSRITYMTYCSGAKIEGQFTWNAKTSTLSDWNVVTVTK